MRTHCPQQSEFIESQVKLQHDIVEKPHESLWLHDCSEHPWNHTIAEHCAYWVFWQHIPESDIVQLGVFLNAVGEDLICQMEEHECSEPCDNSSNHKLMQAWRQCRSQHAESSLLPGLQEC